MRAIDGIGPLSLVQGMISRARAVLMLLNLSVTLMLFVPTMLLSAVLPVAWRKRWTYLWTGYVIASMRVLVGVELRCEGMEHLPDGPFILYSKHNSTLETLILQRIVPDIAWIVKKEAMFLPFFGWGLAVLEPIWIDRKAGRSAVQQIITKGRDQLERGHRISIFPEGTRVPIGESRPYKAGGAILAEATGVPMVCMAHNSGCFWPAKKLLFVKPGVVTYRFRKPMITTGRTAKALTEDARQWIESECEQLYRDAE